MKRNMVFFLLIILSCLMIFQPVKDLFNFSHQREYYSHIVFIPLISIYLIYLNRKTIFENRSYSYKIGVPLLMTGAIFYLVGENWYIRLNQNDYSSLIIFSTVIILIGGFISCYGIQAFHSAIFPLLFLLFMIPIPSLIMDKLIYFLQVGSTEFTNVLFMASGVPYLRDGFIFHLPGMSVEVAKECSGIRSGLALFITALLAGHLFLRTWWKKVILVVCIFPIAMFKNGIRITTLTLLGTYVDPRILQSSLHQEGGIPFFIIALLLMAPVLFFLRKSEGIGSRGKGIG